MSRQADSHLPRVGLPLIAGAYASSAALDPGNERALYLAALSAPGVVGLEFPFFPGRAAKGQSDLSSNTSRDTFNVMTLVGTTVAALATDSRYGLASTDQDGRSRAVADVRAALEEVNRLAEHPSGTPVNGIELQSAPRSWGGSSKAAFARSLDEISSWNWGETQILVEHCDAGKPPRPFSKGFLALEDEVDSIESVFGAGSSAVGVVVNWGRSAIEGMSTTTPVDHVDFLRGRGLLRGIVFSGVTDRPTRGGNAWADIHLPVAHPDRSDGSLLDSYAIDATVHAAGELSELAFIGVKVSSGRSASFEERAQALLFSIASVATAIGAGSQA